MKFPNRLGSMRVRAGFRRRMYHPDMHIARSLFIATLLIATSAALAADDSVPATSNVPGAQYPRVHPDLRVSFRLRAPNAQKVQVQPGGGDNGLGDHVALSKEVAGVRKRG